MAHSSLRSLRRAAFRRGGGTLPILLAAWAVAPAAEIPPRSEERAERFDRWRAQLRDALRALDAERLEEARTGYGNVAEQARAHGRPTRFLAQAVDGLADVHRVAGRPADAVPLYHESATLWEALLGTDQPRLATTLHNLGATYLLLGRGEEAEPYLRRALSIWETSRGADSAEARSTRRALALVREDPGTPATPVDAPSAGQ